MWWVALLRRFVRWIAARDLRGVLQPRLDEAAASHPALREFTDGLRVKHAHLDVINIEADSADDIQVDLTAETCAVVETNVVVWRSAQTGAPLVWLPLFVGVGATRIALKESRLHADVHCAIHQHGSSTNFSELERVAENVVREQLNALDTGTMREKIQETIQEKIQEKVQETIQRITVPRATPTIPRTTQRTIQEETQPTAMFSRAAATNSSVARARTSPSSRLSG